MANTFDLDDRAFDFFAAEAPELLQILESGLLDLSADSTTAEVHEMMRAAHSIKGGAASVGLDTIKTLAHRLEDFLKALYSEAANVDDDIKTLLLHSFDCLRDPLQTLLETGTFDEEEALATAQPYFETLELVLGDALAASQNYIPSSEDLGVDIAASIFDVDVAEGIDRLKSVLASPENFEVAGELRTQLEVFSGFSELLNLKGFGSICSTALAALERHPAQVLEVIALAIADFEAGRAAVLNGDRSQGGEPSSTLQAMATGLATLPEEAYATDANTTTADISLSEITALAIVPDNGIANDEN
ncbi:MAG: Hpt domain-containing protein, partial [Cyanobacteria bacterium J06555_12]